MTTFDRVRAYDGAETLRERRGRLVAPIGSRPGWAPAQEQMAAVLRTQPADIAGVLSRLTAVQAILDALPPSEKANRVAAFNSLYLTITDRVARALPGPKVADPKFLELLDVEFGKRYLTALRLWGEGDDSTPDVWEVLFRRAGDQQLSRLAAAMLGVNAHINHDLSLALIATWERLGPPRDGRAHPDYLLINKIFFQEIPALRRRYSTPFHLRIDRFSGELDDWTQSVLVASTRAWAWQQAERLWALREDRDDFGQACQTMDRASAYVGEMLIRGDGLLTRVGLIGGQAWRYLRARPPTP